MEKVRQAIALAVKKLFDYDGLIDISRPNPQFGDYASNVALIIANQSKQNPAEVAAKIIQELTETNQDWLAKAEVAGPGFINIKLNDKTLLSIIEEINEKGSAYGHTKEYSGQNFVVEYLDPNPMKEIHIGHAYSGTIGDAIATLFETAGAKVHRVTYQGDVGLHVAKAVYGILKRIDHDPAKLKDLSPADRPRFLGETYTHGAQSYEENDEAKAEIQHLNKLIYEQSDPVINEIYETGRSWSLEYFDEVYALFNFTPFEKNYMEGAVAAEGLELVKQHIADGVFKESDGAVIFEGEKYGLHTRVFINSQGLPTYDAKDLGNAMLKMRDYAYDRSIIITGDDQTEYFRVMLKALEQIAPEQAKQTIHIAHGLVKLTTGKMASRTGQVVRALDLLYATEQAAKALASDEHAPLHRTALAAIKYAFLKNRIGGDVIYDVNESVSLEGNSGPYLQYSHARARSILSKSGIKSIMPSDLTSDERRLVNKISEYEEVISAAIKQLAPHLICTFLYELAQQFNSFYEHNRIIGDPREAERLSIVLAYATVLKNGLASLRIPAPDHM